MIPAAAIFDPLPLRAVGAQLRAARFDADPAVAAKGVCVLLNGQTEFIEKYFEVIDELRGRGFAVATMDWRGQGGSSRALGDDSRKGFVGDFSEYEEDLDTLMNWIVTPMLAQASLPFERFRASEGEVVSTGEGDLLGAERKLKPEGVIKPIVLAHSMGGHNLLRYLLRRPGSFARGVLCAPMIGISFRGQRAFLVRAVTAFQTWRGNRSGWVWGMEARDPHRASFASQMVTSDRQRFERTQALLREHPDLRLAGATWGWLGAAMRSMAWLRGVGRAESIATPLLVVGAGADRICLTPQAKAFAERLPQGRYVEIEGAGHEVLMERNAIRARFWAAFDSFMT